MTDEDGNPVDPEEGIKELADVVIEWHANRHKQIDEILESVNTSDKGLKILSSEDNTEIVIEGDKLAGFKAGLHVAKLILGKLPFTLQDNGDEEEEVEEPPAPEPVKPEGFGNFS